MNIQPVPTAGTSRPPIPGRFTEPTKGEKLVSALLSKLPKNEYYVCEEPMIYSNRQSAHICPDFVVVNAWLGVIVLEVKDWVQLSRVDQQHVEIIRRDGVLDRHENPVLTALAYAHNLENRFKANVELLHATGPFQGKLKFPWRNAAILTNIQRATIQEVIEKGIWQAGSVISSNDLTPELFIHALRNIPGAWKLREPLDRYTLDLIRSTLDPEIIVQDKQGTPRGIITPHQKQVIVEPLPKTVITEDVLVGEAEDLVESSSVRLVRGVAGSGKSLVLVRRAQFLADQHPDTRILVMAFNNDLTADLKQRLSATTAVEVTNFHKICRKVLGDEHKNVKDVKDWVYKHYLEFGCEDDLPQEFLVEEIKYRKDIECYDSDMYLELERKGRGQRLTKDKRRTINQIFERYVKAQYEQRLSIGKTCHV